MGDVIRRVNTADRLAGLWRQGSLAAVTLRERLLQDGWYAVQLGERSVVAWLNGVRFELGDQR